MEDYIVYLSLIATVFAGGLFVLILRPNFDMGLKLLLSFSGAFLLSVSVMHLIPEVYQSPQSNIGLFVLLGFLLQLLLEYFSEGIEHGHVHVHNRPNNAFPLVLMISLCIHSLLEGMPLEREIHIEHHAAHDHSDHSLLLGIILHKLPVSIALMTMLIKSRISTQRSFLWLTVFAVMAPLGTFLGHHFGEYLTDQWYFFFDITLAVVVGMFLHISTTILFETNEGHRFNLIKFVMICIGVGTALLTI